MFGPADAISVRRRYLGRRTHNVTVLAPCNISGSYEHPGRSTIPDSCEMIVGEAVEPETHQHTPPDRWSQGDVSFHNSKA